MDEGADSGDILSQVDFDISYKDNAMSLYNKVTNIALSQIETFLPKLESKSYKRISQDHKKANVWRKRDKFDGKIDFKMSSNAIYNLVRALSKPYVGAHIEYKNRDVIVWECESVPYVLKNIESGKVLESNSSYFIVKTYDGAIKITNHEFKKPPKLEEYL